MNQLTSLQALDLYEHVLKVLQIAYVDRHKTNLTVLFREGVRELRYSLDNKDFVRVHLPGSSSAARRAFRRRLARWTVDAISSRAEAREQVLAIIQASRRAGLTPDREKWSAVVSLEFACGACNALDAYTLFLTPGHFNNTQATLQGKLVGVGLDLIASGPHLEVSRVYPKSPAEEGDIAPRDRILRIDRQSVDTLTAAVAAEKLRGEPGTIVEVEILAVGEMVPRTIKLVRRTVLVPSVEYGVTPLTTSSGSLDVGVIRIHTFQDSTPQEVKEALAILQTRGISSLILDLRNNPGGLFKPAVHVANLFLEEGIITHTRSFFREYNRPYKAESLAPFNLPMVVLVDGETASAAEMLAGALKEQGRARLLGQTTFGKGTIQCIIPLKKYAFRRLPSGIRISVAKFLSPNKNPFAIRGVTPTNVCPTDDTTIFSLAKRLLQDALEPEMMMMQ